MPLTRLWKTILICTDMYTGYDPHLTSFAYLYKYQPSFTAVVKIVFTNI